MILSAPAVHKSLLYYCFILIDEDAGEEEAEGADPNDDEWEPDNEESGDEIDNSVVEDNDDDDDDHDDHDTDIVDSEEEEEDKRDTLVDVLPRLGSRQPSLLRQGSSIKKGNHNYL